MTSSIRGTDANGNAIVLRTGDRIRFRRLDNAIAEDVVRCCFTDTVLLAPYGENHTQPAVVLTEHSWTPLSSCVEVL